MNLKKKKKNYQINLILQKIYLKILIHRFNLNYKIIFFFIFTLLLDLIN